MIFAHGGAGRFLLLHESERPLREPSKGGLLVEDVLEPDRLHLGADVFEGFVDCGKAVAEGGFDPNQSFCLSRHFRLERQPLSATGA